VVSGVVASTNVMVAGGSQEAAFDRDLATGWAPGEGVGASIQATFPATATLTSVRLFFIAPSGSRVQELRLTFDDGSTQTFTLADRHGWQELAVRPVRTGAVRLTAVTLTELARRRQLPVYLPEVEFWGYH
jgi:hypothetical protein